MRLELDTAIKMNWKRNYRIELSPTLSGHWYKVHKIMPKGREKFLGYYSSSTTILEAYPLSPFLVDWKVKQGAEEADRILKQAGIRGTAVHSGIEMLLGGAELHKESYSLDEFNRLESFTKWHKEYKPEIISTEQRVFSEKYGYAGTLDVLCKIDGKMSIGDWKTSANIYPHFWLQIASYAQALEEMTDIKVEQTFVCQFGAKNKNGYRFVLSGEWKDHFANFLAVKKTWEYDRGITKDFEPPILELPDTLKL